MTDVRSDRSYGQRYDRIATEDTESLLQDVEPFQPGKESKEPQQTSSRLSRAWASPLNLVRCVAEALLVTAVILLLGRSHMQNCPTQQSIAVAEDITGFAPKFAEKIVLSPDSQFMPENASDFFAPATYEKWLSIVPRGLGFITVKNPEQHENLPSRLLGYPESQFVVTTSMTHQLHCLYAIAKGYSGLKSGSFRYPQEHEWHLGHCFDYIRQGIMCAGDVALEGQETTFPAGITGSDGWDAKHVCKDYDAVYRYLEDNRATDLDWI